MTELSRPFKDYHHALLRERGVEGLEGLATLLERAGHPFDVHECTAYVEGASAGEHPPGWRAWARAVISVLELDEDEAGRFVHAFALGRMRRKPRSRRRGRLFTHIVRPVRGS